MTENTGWQPFTESPVPAAEPAAAMPAEPAPAPEDAAPAGDVLVPPVDAGPGAPFVPDGQPDWLVDAFTGLHQRLVKLGG